MCSTPAPCLAAPSRLPSTRAVVGVVGRVALVVVAAAGAVAAIAELRRRADERRVDRWRTAHDRRWVS